MVHAGGQARAAVGKEGSRPPGASRAVAVLGIVCFCFVASSRPVGAQTTRRAAVLVPATRAAVVANPIRAGDEGDAELDGFVVRKGDPASADLLAAIEVAAREGKWEKAFAAASTLLDTRSEAMVRRPDGFHVSARAYVRQLLLGLPPAGRNAYRVFNDAIARRALEQSDSPEAGADGAGRVARLQDLFDRYFITSVGDRIADRLGDAKFESGDFAGAARCWAAISSDYPDTSLPASRILVKRAVALSRAESWEELRAVKSQLREKYADRSVRLGGRDVPVAALVDDSARSGGGADSPVASAPAARSESTRPAAADLLPAESARPVWQMLFQDGNLQEQIKRAALNTRGVGFDHRSVIPGAAAAEGRVYLNWLGIGMAVDAGTGKLLWRSEPFSRVVPRVQQVVLNGYDSGESSVLVSPGGDRLLLTNPAASTRMVTLNAAGVVFGVRPGGAQPRFVQMSVRPGSGTITCLSGTDGRLVWSSESQALPDLSALGILGRPQIVEDTVYVVTTPITMYQASEIDLTAISLADGTIRWKVALGAFGATANVRGMTNPPKPVLRREGERLYVLTGNGALLAVDLPGRRVEWAFTYPPGANISGRLVGSYRVAEPEQFESSIESCDGLLLFKEKGSNILYAVDPAGPSLKWQRRVDADVAVFSAGASMFYLLGNELSAIDPATRDMRWSARTPLGSRQFRPVVDGGRAYVFGLTGVYGVDLQGGAIRSFAGVGVDSGGGAVIRADDRLVCISTRAATAYAVPGKPGGGP